MWASPAVLLPGGAFAVAAAAEPFVKLIGKLTGAMVNYSTLGTFLASVLDLLRESRNLASSLIVPGYNRDKWSDTI